MNKNDRDKKTSSKPNNDPFYSEANQTLLKKSIKEMEETGGTIHDIDLDE